MTITPKAHFFGEDHLHRIQYGCALNQSISFFLRILSKMYVNVRLNP